MSSTHKKAPKTKGTLPEQQVKMNDNTIRINYVSKRPFL
jgi:hypothetical protein